MGYDFKPPCELVHFQDVSSLQPVEKKKKTLFKEKPPRPKPSSKKKMTKQVLMYDSDSIDIDVLASFNAKTFCAGKLKFFDQISLTICF